ncbi:radical SAM protein, partial [Candidatus Gottesmanbacteria bacterium]|nr:radical SAM protein [Candidatus Gottesmanbacteria bacterium]
MAESIVKEIRAKSILVPSKLPDTEYVINPYVGCAFGCSYCYASFMGRFVGKTVADWGNYVFAKVNLPEVLNRELAKMKDKSKSILLSSVTDPYQGVEQKYQLTRKALELLLKHNWQGTVGILTKSPLVTRDIDLFKKFPHAIVGVTVTST